jgi:hypothetical protein
MSSILGFLKRLVRWGEPAGEPLDLTVPDQYILRALFLSDDLTFEELAQVIRSEAPTISRLELLSALQKLLQAGLVLRREPAGPEGADLYRAAPRAQRLRGVIPTRPTVPMNVYLY